jgi:tetratricopeptide (TPR) repeat protein
MHVLTLPLLGALLLAAGQARAQPQDCAPEARVGYIQAIAGEVRLDGARVAQAVLPLAVCAGSTVSTGADSRVQLYADGADTGFRLDENSASRLHAPPGPQSGLVEMLQGGLFFLSQVRRSLTVRTPYMTAGVEGTEVLIRLAEGGDTALDLIVYDGRVGLTPPPGGAAPPAAALTTGQRLTVERDGQAEIERLEAAEGHAALRLAAGRDLAWTLYYPPIVGERTAGLSPEIVEAARLLRSGRAEEARSLLRGIAGDAAEAPARDALLAMVAMTQGDNAGALALAQAAVERRPDSGAALLALSYAEQAHARLEAARDAARRATGAAPEDGLAWARLAEMEMAFGDTRAARQAAERSLAAEPTPLAQTVLGFTELAAHRTSAAAERFRAALAVGSEQPLAHLGQGLALIRRGDLALGRRSIEVAATLDPTRSLLRSYLGKAFFTERRDDGAATQLAIAKELDPEDPTPWLYDAIRKQLDNRPVEALRDLERSIELNDNRATFRSGLLLDQDQATRAVSLARIYDDLGFDELGRMESSRSLAVDPWSSAAHRFLSDIYRGEPRAEVARVSELLQAQLLQPLNANPVQPSLAFTDLNIVAAQGPARVALDEYGPLFNSDGLRLSGTGALGTDDTWADEAVVSGMFGRAALSLGQFHYETDGFRANNDLDHDIFNALAQVELTETVTVQAEYRRRDTDQGDRRLFFSPDDFQPNLRESIEQDIWRLGTVWRPRPGVGLMFSAMMADEEETESDSFFVPIDPPLAGSAKFNEARDSRQLEAQAFFGDARHRLVVGGGLYDTDINLKERFINLVDDVPFEDRSRDRTDQQGKAGYAYYFTTWPEELQWTLGVGLDRIEIEQRDDVVASPKLGVEWRASSWLTLRAAAFRAVAKPLVADSTIEPTQILGFSQLFDDFPGTRSDQLSASIELRPHDDVRLVGWGALRELSVPVRSDDTRGETERSFGAAAYWMATERIVLGAGATVREFEQTDSDAQANTPAQMTTIEAPLSVRYFSPSGWFAGATATWIDQEVDYATSPTLRKSAGEAILDSFVGYRLPNRRGLLTLEGRNLLDKEFSFQDESFRTADLPNPQRLPTRSVIVRLTLSF